MASAIASTVKDCNHPFLIAVDIVIGLVNLLSLLTSHQGSRADLLVLEVASQILEAAAGACIDFSQSPVDIGIVLKGTKEGLTLVLAKVHDPVIFNRRRCQGRWILGVSGFTLGSCHGWRRGHWTVELR